MQDIIITDLSKQYDRKPVIHHLNLTIKAGAVTCIMGPSGCGKTTLLYILTGLVTPDQGRITGMPDRISFVFQEDRLCEEFSALANLKMVTGKKRSDAELRTHLSLLGLADITEKPVHQLSGGMKRRVAIARAICYPSEILLLDEPFKGLDENRKKETIRYILDHREGRTILCITHDTEDAELLDADLIRM